MGFLETLRNLNDNDLPGANFFKKEVSRLIGGKKKEAKGWEEEVRNEVLAQVKVIARTEVLPTVRKAVLKTIRELQSSAIPFEHTFDGELITKKFDLAVGELIEQFLKKFEEVVKKHTPAVGPFKLVAPPFAGQLMKKATDLVAKVAAEAAAAAMKFVEVADPPLIKTLKLAAEAAAKIKVTFGVNKGKTSPLELSLDAKGSAGAKGGVDTSLGSVSVGLGIGGEAKLTFLFDDADKMALAMMVAAFEAIGLIKDGEYDDWLEGLVIAEDLAFLTKVMVRMRVDLDGTGQISMQFAERASRAQAAGEARGTVRAKVNIYFWPSHTIVKFDVGAAADAEVEAFGHSGDVGVVGRSQGVFKVASRDPKTFIANPKRELEAIGDDIKAALIKYGIVTVRIGGIEIQGKTEELNALKNAYDKGEYEDMLICLRDGVSFKLTGNLAAARDLYRRGEYLEAAVKLADAFREKPRTALTPADAKVLISKITTANAESGSSDSLVKDMLHDHPDVLKFAKPSHKAKMLECLMTGGHTGILIDSDREAMRTILRSAKSRADQNDILRSVPGGEAAVKQKLGSDIPSPKS